MAAFTVCAVITLAVGGVGMLGINRLSDALELTFSNNLVSVANTNETMTALTTHNRGLYRLLDAKDTATAEKMRQSINAELERAQKSMPSTARLHWRTMNVQRVISTTP